MLARVFIALVMVIGATALAPPLAAQKLIHRTPGAAANFPDDSISIVTQAAPGRDADRIAELARVYAGAGGPRVLPVAGLGPIANARDLLHMRGIDFAVLDSDIRAYARLEGGLQGADTHLTQIMKLYDKTVYVVAVADVKSLADLTGQKVLVLGEDSDGHVTARTVFGLLRIAIDLAAADQASANKALAAGGAKAIVLVAPVGENPLAGLPQDKGLHLLSVPASAALDAIYERTTLPDSQTVGFAPSGGMPTLRVATLLATYLWRPNLYRFGPVQQFLLALPPAMASLRGGGAAAFWRSVDAQASIPNWQPYDAAQTALAAIPPAVAVPPTIVAALPTTAPQTAPPAPLPVAKPVAGGIALIASALPGLANPDTAGGGLIAELAASSLPGEKVRLEWVSDAQGVARQIETAAGAQLGLAWRRPDCAGKEPLSPADKTLCERFLFSAPIFQALDVFFVRRGSDFTFERDEQVAGRSICAAADADIAALDANGRRWLKQDLLTLLRRPTLAACFSALEKGDVDAVFADELAGTAAIEKDGLVSRVQVVDRAVAVRDLSAIAAKSNPAAPDLLARLDAGLAALKADGRYSALVVTRMHRLEVLSGELIVK